LTLTVETSVTSNRTAASATVEQQRIRDGAAKAPEMMLIDGAPHLLVAKTVFLPHAGAEIITKPTSWAQMLLAPDTREWMLSAWNEFHSHRDNDTFPPTSVLPKGYALLETTWIFRCKLLASFTIKLMLNLCLQLDIEITLTMATLKRELKMELEQHWGCTS
jgi:hypothetical protein